MLEFITPSEDYLNEWQNTRAFSIYTVREFRESIEKGDNDIMRSFIYLSLRRVAKVLSCMTQQERERERERKTICNSKYKTI